MRVARASKPAARGKAACEHEARDDSRPELPSLATTVERVEDVALLG